MAKIDEIRERAEKVDTYYSGSHKICRQDVPNLCDALEYARGVIKKIPPEHYAEKQLAKIDQILEGKDGKD